MSANHSSERWLPVVGFFGYEVSNRGRVMSHKGLEPRILKPGLVAPHGKKHPGKYLRPCVILRRDGKSFNRQVCRLVLEAFVGPCPEGMECRHLNDNPMDNQVENLAWGTHEDNCKDRGRNGNNPVGCRNGNAILNEDQVREIRCLLAQGVWQKHVAARFSISQQLVSAINNRLVWGHLP